MRLTAFFKLYKICILLHRRNLKILAKNRFENSAIFVKFSNNFANVAILQNFAKVQKIQLDDLVDFEKMLQNAYLLAKIGADTAENERTFAEGREATVRFSPRSSLPSTIVRCV